MIEIENHQAAATGFIPEKFKLLEGGEAKYFFSIKNDKISSVTKKQASFYHEKYTNKWDKNFDNLKFITFENKPSTNFKLISNEGNNYTLCFNDKYSFELNKNCFSDLLLSGAIGSDLNIIKPLIYAVFGKTSAGCFIVENGYLHKQILKSNNLESLKSVNVSDLEPNTIYMTSSGKKELLLGKFKTKRYILPTEVAKELRKNRWSYDEKVTKPLCEKIKDIILNNKFKIKSEDAFVSISLSDNKYYSNEQRLKNIFENIDEENASLYDLNFRVVSNFKEKIGKSDEVPKDFIKKLRKKKINELNKLFLNDDNKSSYYNSSYRQRNELDKYTRFIESAQYINLYGDDEEPRGATTYNDIIIWL